MKYGLPCLLILLVSPCLASHITIITNSVPDGTVGTAYSTVITASGGCTPYNWAIVSGSLPAGVSGTVSSSTTALDLNGSPSSAGTYSFTVSATGCGRRVAKASYTIVIQATTNHVVQVSWTASTSSDVAGYNVYRGPDGMTWKKVNASLVASTDYDDSTVADGSTYYYAATAVDIYGEESVKAPAIEVTVP